MNKSNPQNSSTDELDTIAQRLANYSLPEHLWSYQYMLMMMGAMVKEINQGLKGGAFSESYMEEKIRKLESEMRSMVNC